MGDCYTPGQLVSDALCKLATQYRESPKLKAFITVFIEEVELVQKALCDSAELDLDRLGVLLNFPRCWCNIKRRVWFGLEKPAPLYFGFNYEVGETPSVAESCLGGFDEARWIHPDDNPDCSLEAMKGCCTVGDPTVKGFCEADFICPDYPQHVDHCFDDDVEYAMLLNAKLLSDNSAGTVDDILNVAIIMYGEQTTIFYDSHGVVWVSLNRAITDNEILLMDFYKNLLPAPVGVTITIVDGLHRQFGFTDSPCLEDRIGGFCDGVFMRRY